MGAPEGPPSESRRHPRQPPGPAPLAPTLATPGPGGPPGSALDRTLAVPGPAPVGEDPGAHGGLAALPPEARRLAADPRQRIGRYVWVRELGRGGMGLVLDAWDLQLGRRVALKLLLDPDLAGAEGVARFHREARAAAQVRHPGIVGILDVGVHLGRPYMALEFVEGESLEARLRREGRCPAPVAALLVRDVARALGAAHRLGILHRDVKPANVLLDAATGAPRLADFGLARSVGGRSVALTRTGAILGTPSYMAPEQAGDSATTHGPPSDVYGLGAVLYRALCGRPPLEAESVTQFLVKLATEAPIPPRRHDPTIPPALEAIVLRCLEREPSRRFPHADALADALTVWLEGGAAPARRWPARAALVALGLGGALAALGLGGALAAARARRDDAAPVASSAAPPPPAPPPVAPWPGPAPAPGERSAAGHLVVAAVAGTNRWMHADSAWCLDVTCDGRRVLTGDGHWVGDGPGRLLVWEAATGAPVAAFTVCERRRVTFVAAAPADARLALVGGEDGSVALWDVEGRARVASVAPPGPRVPRAAAWVGPDRAAVAWSNGLTEVWEGLPGGPARLARTLGEESLTPLDAGVVARGTAGHVITFARERPGVVEWDARTGQAVATLDERPAYRAAVHPSGRVALLLPRPPGDDPDATELLQLVGGGAQLDLVNARGAKSLAWRGEHELVVAWRRGDGLTGFDAIDVDRSPPSARTLRFDHQAGYEVPACRVLPDGDTLVTAGEDLTHGRFDLRGEDDLRRLPPDEPPGWLSGVVPLDARRVVVARSGGRDLSTLRVIDRATGALEASLRTGLEWIRGLDVRADGLVLAVGSSGRGGLNVGLWDPARGTFRTAAADEGGERVGGGAFVEGGLALVVGERGRCHVWDSTRGDDRTVLPPAFDLPPGPRPYAVAAWAAGARALFATSEGLFTVRLESLGAPAARALDGIDLRCAAVAEPPGGAAISVCGAADGRVLTWEPDRGGQARVLGRHALGVAAVAVSGDGARAATASRDGAVKLWDLAGRRELDALDLAPWGDSSEALAFLPDGATLVVASRRGLVLSLALERGAAASPAAPWRTPAGRPR